MHDGLTSVLACDDVAVAVAVPSPDTTLFTDSVMLLPRLEHADGVRGMLAVVQKDDTERDIRLPIARLCGSLEYASLFLARCMHREDVLIVLFLNTIPAHAGPTRAGSIMDV